MYIYISTLRVKLFVCVCVCVCDLFVICHDITNFVQLVTCWFD
jgi:hypothetical protein